MAIRQLRGTSGSRFSDEPLFDTTRIVASSASVIAAQQIDFFQTTFGAGTSPLFNTGAKTQSDTNLEGTGGVIPNKSAFVCRQIGVQVGFTVENATEAGRGRASGPLVDLLAIQRSCDLYFRSQVEEQFLGPIWQWPAGGGPWVQYSTVVNADALGVVNNGIPSLQAMRKLHKRLILPAGLSFRFSIYFRAAVTLQTASLPLLFVVLLRGYWIKPA